jgi:hypothetical protein
MITEKVLIFTDLIESVKLSWKICGEAKIVGTFIPISGLN